MLETTRLAPSPTGALHLGNARTFLVNWLLARQRHWKITLRIEDLDGPRIKRGADRATLEDLRWLGIDWDEGPIYQTQRRDRYRKVIDELIKSGQAYPCVCTRRDVENAASAPHLSDQSVIYPGICRDRFTNVDHARRSSGREPAIRFRVPDLTVCFDDQFAGAQSFDSRRDVGDFVIAKADGTPAYQLSVTIDDLDMNVTQVVRGNDLMLSTAKQLLLMRALSPASLPPTYTHLPLIIGVDGRRLAKRHGDSRISSYRERGVSAAAVLALLSQWCALNNGTTFDRAESLIDSFALNKISPRPIAFTADDEMALLGGNVQIKNEF